MWVKIMGIKKNQNQILFYLWFSLLITTMNYTSIEVTQYVNEIKQEKVELQAQQEKVAKENREKELEEQLKMVGVNKEGKEYTYDAKEIQKKLKSCDYSNDGNKIVFLTFDDGSSTSVTPKILETLKEEGVRATFFVCGKTIEDGGEKAKELIKTSFDYGNAIGNHSYSHDYHTLYPGRNLDIDAFKKDFQKTDEILKDILGEHFSTRVIRCPGGYISWNKMDKLDEYLDENNMAEIDWNALNSDAEGKKKNAQELVKQTIKTSSGKDIVVLLMHDTYGKDETAKALPDIIRYFKEQGYEFKTLS
ncbi:polysaccharide deacetylase [Romboutsia ilealis]|uniref:Polysaccharide deacetylase n=2 Tax=Romboutsia faecis TaxID=2764597 RepID=A0ABR7JKD5_9FIRM|nr:polysaccharide deacetylase [Romboutsia faecis]MRN24369.1 polysaccharide deacetylase [Romboutsia ilealis]